MRGSAAHLPVELHGQDGVGVAVVADLGPFLKVANLQLPGSFEAGDGHQAAGEQSLHGLLHLQCQLKGEKANPCGHVSCQPAPGAPHTSTSEGRLPRKGGELGEG